MDQALDSISKALEQVKRLAKNGGEYWMGRDIQTILGYSTWERFQGVIGRAMASSDSAGQDPINHFHQTAKMITIGRGGKRPREDYFLDRYACYLIAINGDTPEAGIAQSYFVVQTRRQEVFDKLTAAEKRIELRNRVKDANNKLKEVANEAGVQQWAYFYAAGYHGLYDMGIADIRKKKNLGQKEDLLDRMGREELAINEFRITQTEAKLVRDGISGDQQAIDTHRKVGREIRHTIKNIGGTMPEDLPTEPPIKQLETQQKKLLTGKCNRSLPKKST